MCAARIEAPNGYTHVVKVDETLDSHNEEILSSLPPEDSEVLRHAFIVGEVNGYILELPEGDPILITKTFMETIPPAYKRGAVPIFEAREDNILYLPQGTKIIPLTNDQ